MEIMMKQVYAIVRLDKFQDDRTSPENRITVKKIVRDAATACAEVDRLNKLNSAKECIYFWQATRIDE
jgi:hypothetical protein